MAREKKSRQLADQAMLLAEHAAKAMVAAEQRRIKTKAVKHFPLSEDERSTVAAVPALPARLKKKLLNHGAAFTVADTAGLVMAAAVSFLDVEPKKQTALLGIAKRLSNCLQAEIAVPRATDTIFQFKITLREITPLIWRRIQIKDCTLDRLHELIQTAMGWSNSHLYQFCIGDQLYSDPVLTKEDMDEMNYKDSSITMVSDIMPKDGKRFCFDYEYDFGDSWEHEVLFEGFPQPIADGQYPICLEGARACPPEDCGGVWGYAEFLEAIADKHHEQYSEMLEWAGGWFDPEEFDPVVATKSMTKGLPDWRSMV